MKKSARDDERDDGSGQGDESKFMQSCPAPSRAGGAEQPGSQPGQATLGPHRRRRALDDQEITKRFAGHSTARLGSASDVTAANN